METIDTYTEQSLKSGIGTDAWKRFFLLMSAMFAMFEHRNEAARYVPGVPNDFGSVFRELNLLIEQLNLEQILKRLVVVTEHFHQDLKAHKSPAPYQILVLKLGEDSVDIHGFHDSVSASEEYVRLEKSYIGHPSVQMVLVSVDSVSALRKAYPNYFQDTAEFVTLLEQTRRGWLKYVKGRTEGLPR